VVTKLDRLARSLPDARAIADELTQRHVRLNLGGSVHDPTDPVGRLLFNVLAMVAEFETDLFRLRTREAMKVARAKGRLRGKQPKLNHRQEVHLVALFDGGDHSTAELADLLASLVPPCTGRWNGSGLACRTPSGRHYAAPTTSDRGEFRPAGMQPLRRSQPDVMMATSSIAC
jgi:Resolvase, N terminal domain